MSDASQPSRRLSEISHLFLSSVREKQTGGAARPTRKAPGTFQPEPVLDMSPEEYARVNDRSELDLSRIKPIQAVIAAHYGQTMTDRARQFAATLCIDGGRVGIIYADASDVRISCIERNPQLDMQTPEPAIEMMEGRRLNEALVELNADVDRWLMVLADPRGGDARDVLRSIVQWTLLCDVNHDSVVASYRTLKGLADPAKPRVTLSVHQPRDIGEVDRIYRKLSGVCEQFLHLPLEPGRAFSDHDDVIEHVVLHATASHNKAALAAPPHWKVLLDFALQSQHDHPDTTSPIARAAHPESPRAQAPATEPAMTTETAEEWPESESHPVQPARSEPPHAEPLRPEPIRTEPLRTDPRRPIMRSVSPVMSQPAGLHASGHSHSRDARVSDISASDTSLSDAIIGSIVPAKPDFETIIDLPNSDLASPSIVSAVIRGGGDLVDSPIKPPSCPQASVTVSRDHQLVLVAVCRQGLHDMRSIAAAYRWLVENRNLIGMALPQMSIDIGATPRLQLLVDHSDISADMLQPLMQSSHVCIRTYRKLRWGEKTGLLLEAA